MALLRLAIVTRKFWPMSEPSQLSVAEIANQFERSGHQVSIVTARWEKNWPTHFEYCEVPIARVNKPSSGPFGSFRYSRGVARWLGDLDRLDGVIVWGLGEDVVTARRATSSRGETVAVAARVDQAMLGVGIVGPSLRKSINQLSAADIVIADSEPTKKRLMENGLTLTPIEVIPDPIASLSEECEDRTIANQGAARIALADAHPVLATDTTAPLVVTGAAMNGDGGVFDLVAAWPIVLKSYPKAKAWILGDGPQGKQVWEAIEAQDLIYSVIMPGYFDHLGELFMASDLYVHPLRTGQWDNTLVRAMARGVCPVATDTDFTKSIVRKNENALVVPPGNYHALAEAILHGLENRDLRVRLGNEARKIRSTDFRSESIAEQFLEALNLKAIETSQ